ncbi:MAG: hypothetical protein KDC67_06585 [Ignavibacteriae bacterium]|nr:hypothetical protein [Ignavibacteriota bacterium]
MAKKNLPNIPIYIGDWERDCNVLSLEAEAAWMRIVFKLWTKGKQNAIKIPAKALQNLWRCSDEKMTEIIQELTYNEICPISTGDGFVEFTCRRFVKENELSEIRSDAAKSSKSSSKSKAKPKQKQSKNEQNADNENDNESDFVSKKKNYAEFVFLKVDEYEKFVAEHGEAFIKKCITKLNDYKESSGKKYKSDAAAIRTWVIDEIKKVDKSTILPKSTNYQKMEV